MSKNCEDCGEPLKPGGNLRESRLHDGLCIVCGIARERERMGDT